MNRKGLARARGSLSARLYRSFQERVVGRWVLPRLVSEERLRQGNAFRLEPGSRKPRAWFHAASVGELETLIPVIDAWVTRGNEVIVTVLSESAQRQVARLQQSLEGAPGKVVFAGYSPWEGKWQDALEQARPSIFVTAKYEAWPELWLSLGELGIPLVIVSCRARRSLRVAKALCRVLGGQVPRMSLLAVHDEDEAGLRELFPEATVSVVGEPRWDRVNSRAKAGNPRATELVRAFSSCPRPWGVLGSAWMSDLEVWKACLPALGGPTFPGTIWIVPHQIEEDGIEEIMDLLKQVHLSPLRTARERGTVSGESTNCLLVDEMGVLSELYASADWAFVGGGFGAGVHSTIEPALYGIPVAAGPAGAGKFPEIAELQETGQLRILSDSACLSEWLGEVLSGEGLASGGKRNLWKADAAKRLGATERVLRAMDEAIAQALAAC